jgi:hypothetical protein
MTRPRIEALPVHRSARILYGKLEVVRYRTCRVAARFLKGRVVRAVWVQLERPDRRGAPSEERLLVCTDPDLPATEVITSYAKRWSVEPLFAAMKHGWGLKDAWQQSRQVLMRWVTILAAGYALSQMLAYTDPARIPGLAAPAPWRPPGTRTAGLIQAGLARLLRGVGPPGLILAIWRKSDLPSDRFPRGRASASTKAPEATGQTSSRCRRGSLSGTSAAACKLQLILLISREYARRTWTRISLQRHVGHIRVGLGPVSA